MIDFNKRLGDEGNQKEIDPIKLYETLDRESDKGPLRPAQIAILTDWYESRRDDKDVIIKLHTGQGKTLIGLLILQSKLNQNLGPVVYICPNIYLVEQTHEQAKQFGIRTCKIDDRNNFPDDFWNSKAILITHVQKMFNGTTIFKLGNQSIKINSIVLDDSHACIDTIEESSTILIPRSCELYNKILNVFQDALEEQGFAKLEEIRREESFDVMNVPYWAWKENYKEVAQEILQFRTEDFILFAWPLVKDLIQDCHCFISAQNIEIKPYSNPIEQFGSFYRAEHRVMMSATTNNDAFFVKGLNINPDIIINPLTCIEEKWSGEKMILIPYQIDEQLGRTEIVNWLAKPIDKRPVGVVVITPSFKDAEFWKKCGAEIAYPQNLKEKVDQLKSGDFKNVIVFANRYDGIDLPDNSCRVLILDKKPHAQSLRDQYEQEVRSESKIIHIKVAQKIEQGLGRGVRGEKDYCVIILIGTELVNAAKNPKLKQFFSAQTQEQINIGIDITKYALEDAAQLDSHKIVSEIMAQCLKRDEGWKKFYKQRMDTINIQFANNSIIEVLQLEREADQHYLAGNYLKAKDIISKIISNYISEDNIESGWYYQEMARFTYPLSKIDSNKLQIIAHGKNRFLLKPSSGMQFKKLEVIEERITAIRNWVTRFDNYEELKTELEYILSNLNFRPEAKKFEIALEKVGIILGFASERPEETWKSGPDNLWCIAPSKYLIIECKTGTSTTRAEIYQHESEQLLNSQRWFEEKYPFCEGIPVMVINTNMVSKGAFMPTNGKILKESKLSHLKRNIRDFYREFANRQFDSLSNTSIQEWLNGHSLSSNSILQLLVAPKYHK